MLMKIGIEYEFTLKDKANNYLDFDNTEYGLFKQVVDDFPYYENDAKVFECKSLEKVPKRCYVEGFERYDTSGKLLGTIPKGLEIRTLPHATIDEALEELDNSYSHIKNSAELLGLSPLEVSYHPFKNFIALQTPLNSFEIDLRKKSNALSADIALNAMLWHSIQINVSIDNSTTKQMTNLVQKINYYAPFIIPFSFSSPFCNGEPFKGLSYRSYVRSSMRQIVKLQKRNEIDVIEFMGFDTFYNLSLFKALLLLFKGLLIDTTLTKRALSRDIEYLQRSALKGFEDEAIKQEGIAVFSAAKAALKEEGAALQHLETMLQTNDSYAARMKRTYQETGDIMETISNKYNY